MIASSLMVAVNVAIIAFQMFTLILLCTIKERNATLSQKYLIFTLCFEEMLLAFGGLLGYVFTLLDIDESFPVKICKIFHVTMVNISYMLLMIVITIDRFLIIYLNIKYPLYCIPRKIVIVVVLILCSCLCFFFGFLSKYLSSQTWNPYRILYLFVYPIIQSIFLLTAISTYIYIYRQLKRNKEQSHNSVQHMKDSKNNPKSKVRKRFNIFVPNLIILTFVLFTVLPHIVWSIKFWFGFNLPESASYFVALMIDLGLIADPLIYVFNLESVRKKIKRLRPSRLNDCCN